MDFKSLKVKQVLEDPELYGILLDIVPGIKKYPVKLLGNRTCGEIFGIVVSKGLATKEEADDAERRINEALENKYT